ncbi:TetR/AcrR family transcriptional regulator [Collimonas pratensis]|uniref:Bacterial regulatory s, tetR family protein n=1 Tax=Collimonas pratensis TaxID=279113 RepID=A0A127Q3N6_9BURK|nr:TetR/AcrR family transcriptional regulator [Collimonas pratensis]AMP04631.1 bacterial regulatory s, tetR family protein [Collimonas pratensis]
MEPIKSRREEYADATRTALLATAREIFTAEGYQQTGIEAVARAARVTRGAFYHHFDDKQALFEALVIDLQKEAASKIAAQAKLQPDLRAKLSIGAKAFLEVCTEPSYRRLVIQEAAAVLGVERCRQISETYPYGLLIEAIKGLQQRGEFDVENPYLASRMIGAMICEASLHLEQTADSALPARQATAIIDRVLGAFYRDSS